MSFTSNTSPTFVAYWTVFTITYAVGMCLSLLQTLIAWTDRLKGDEHPGLVARIFRYIICWTFTSLLVEQLLVLTTDASVWIPAGVVIWLVASASQVSFALVETYHHVLVLYTTRGRWVTWPLPFLQALCACVYLASIGVAAASLVTDQVCLILVAAGFNLVVYLASILWIAWRIRSLRIYIETEFKGFHLCSNGHVVVRQDARKYILISLTFCCASLITVAMVAADGAQTRCNVSWAQTLETQEILPYAVVLQITSLVLLCFCLWRSWIRWPGSQCLKLKHECSRDETPSPQSEPQSKSQSSERRDKLASTTDEKPPDRVSEPV